MCKTRKDVLGSCSLSFSNGCKLQSATWQKEMLRLSMSVSGLKKYQIKLPLRNHFHLGLQHITLGHVKNHHWLLLALETFMTDMFPVPTLPNSCLYPVTCSKSSGGAENEAKCGFIYWNKREAQPEMEAENGIRHSPASSAKSTQWPLFSHIVTLLVARMHGV